MLNCTRHCLKSPVIQNSRSLRGYSLSSQEVMMSHIDTILKFMPKSQALCFRRGLRSSESSYFQEVAKKISEVIENSPAIYETDDKGEEVKPVLHYFWDNVDIFVTEIDKSSNEHFGYTSLGFGYLEAGYINLDYIFESLPLINLDFNFKPETISKYKQRFEG